MKCIISLFAKLRNSFDHFYKNNLKSPIVLKNCTIGLSILSKLKASEIKIMSELPSSHSGFLKTDFRIESVPFAIFQAAATSLESLRKVRNCPASRA